MTCRCRSKEEHEVRRNKRKEDHLKNQINKLEKERENFKADIKNYEIIDVYEENVHYLILKIKYTHKNKKARSDCTFEGMKILVYKNVGLKDVILWKEIDPHFKRENKNPNKQVAPPPIARFPASDEGLQNAIHFVKSIVE